MRKIAIAFLSIILLLATFFGVACTVEYKLTVDISKAEGVEFLQEFDKSYQPGTSLTVKTPIYTDVDLWAYLDGESLGKQRPIKTGENYTHWEFYFTMPAHDAVLSFAWAQNDGSHTCSLVCLEEIQATCQKEGLSVIGCTDCGYIYEQTVLPKVDCQFGADGKCIWCREDSLLLSNILQKLPFEYNVDGLIEKYGFDVGGKYYCIDNQNDYYEFLSDVGVPHEGPFDALFEKNVILCYIRGVSGSTDFIPVEYYYNGVSNDIERKNKFQVDGDYPAVLLCWCVDIVEVPRSIFQRMNEI